MSNEAEKSKKKLDKLLKITNITDKDLNKLNYKEKQKYYAAKSKLGKFSFISRDKLGTGQTLNYSKQPKEVIRYVPKASK